MEFIEEHKARYFLSSLRCQSSSKCSIIHGSTTNYCNTFGFFKAIGNPKCLFSRMSGTTKGFGKFWGKNTLFKSFYPSRFKAEEVYDFRHPHPSVTQFPAWTTRSQYVPCFNTCLQPNSCNSLDLTCKTHRFLWAQSASAVGINPWPPLSFICFPTLLCFTSLPLRISGSIHYFCCVLQQIEAHIWHDAFCQSDAWKPCFEFLWLWLIKGASPSSP